MSFFSRKSAAKSSEESSQRTEQVAEIVCDPSNSLHHDEMSFVTWQTKPYVMDKQESATELEETKETYVMDSDQTPPHANSTRSGSSRRAWSSNDTGKSCCARLTAELNPCQPWFRVEEKATGRKIDIPESFAPATCLAFLCKVCLFGFTVGTMVYAILQTPSKEFFFAYITHWALLFACIYQGLSLLNTTMAARTPQPPDTVGWRIRITWIFYSMAVHTEICVTILWWSLLYKPGETTLNFLAVVPHCVIAALVWIDGNWLNRIPIRWMHWYGFVFPVDLFFVVWSIIHSQLGIGNPNEHDEDPTTDDDVIYPALNWNDHWQSSTITSVIVMFVMSPLIYLILWLVSAYNVPCFCKMDRRYYIDSYKDARDTRPTVDDVEEGSIFARWRY